MLVNRVFYSSTFLLLTYCTDIQIRRFGVDIGNNLTLSCPQTQSKDVMWIREGREDGQKSRLIILEDGSLFLEEVDRNDSGIYYCMPENVVDQESVKSEMKVIVRTPPPALPNVTVHPSTILAILIWEVNETGGYPISHFTAEYRLASEEEWKPISPNNISPNLRRLEIYKLEPNTTYAFRLWAVNQLGMGEITEVLSTTLHNYTEMELANHLLAGVEKFDKRVWVLAVAVVMGTLVVLGIGTCFLLYQECKIPGVPDETEVIELVPNIILNPGFEGNIHTEHIPADENFNNETAVRLNNNTVIQPRNL